MILVQIIALLRVCLQTGTLFAYMRSMRVRSCDLKSIKNKGIFVCILADF